MLLPRLPREQSALRVHGCKQAARLLWQAAANSSSVLFSITPHYHEPCSTNPSAAAVPCLSMTHADSPDPLAGMRPHGRQAGSQRAARQHQRTPGGKHAGQRHVGNGCKLAQQAQADLRGAARVGNNGVWEGGWGGWGGLWDDVGRCRAPGRVFEVR